MTNLDLAKDEVFLDLLAQTLDCADPVPEEAVAVARAVGSLQAVDAELAALVADSLLDEDVVLFRGDPIGQLPGRLVSFAADRLEVDIELPGRRGTVFGTITPPAALPIALETMRGTATTSSDDLGRFHLQAPPGPCRLRVGTPGEALVTPWITR